MIIENSSFSLNKNRIVEHTVHSVTPRECEELYKRVNSKKIQDVFKRINMDIKKSDEQLEIYSESESILVQHISTFCHDVCSIQRYPMSNQLEKSFSILLCSHCRIKNFFHCCYFIDNSIIYMNNNFSSVICSAKDVRLICKEFHNNIYVPDDKTWRAIFQLHKNFLMLSSKNPHMKSANNHICYSETLHLIHYNIGDYLFNLNQAPEIISQHDYEEQPSVVISEKKRFFDRMFCLDQDFDKSFSQITKKIKAVKDTTPFTELSHVLMLISNENFDTIKKLAILLAKVYLGRSCLKYLDKDTSHLTCIISNNPYYIKKFLQDIFGYNMTPEKFSRTIQGVNMYSQSPDIQFKCNAQSLIFHKTEYSAAQLGNETMIGEFIKGKFYGNIVNIDTTKTPLTSIGKNLIEGKSISYSDPILGKMSHKSNAHFIRINESVDDLNLGDYNILNDKIFLEGNLANIEYEPLHYYELFFLVTGFVQYGLDLLLTSEESPTIQEIRSSQLVDEFIMNFCFDQAKDIKVPAQYANTKSDEDLKQLRQELNITDLEFTHTGTLYENFKIWMKICHKNIPCCPLAEFRSTLEQKYHPAFYTKKMKKVDGKPKDARGLYGVSVDKDKFNNLQAKQDNSESSPSERKDLFLDQLEEILKKYALCPDMT